jgi:hypothetical protein
LIEFQLADVVPGTAIETARPPDIPVHFNYVTRPGGLVQSVYVLGYQLKL